MDELITLIDPQHYLQRSEPKHFTAATIVGRQNCRLYTRFFSNYSAV